MTEKKRPELLVPAGSPEVLKVAVGYGADAVYIGGEEFSLRAKAKNFGPEEMAEGIAYAHERGVKVYVTANILAHEAELKDAGAYFEELAELKPDALIISDPGLFMLARRHCPQIPVHISTQASNTNSESFAFWHAQGAKRVVCARELTLSEIREIRKAVPEELQIECFVHGAMCASYSGRCFLSASLMGRSANQGECTHPCRWKYYLVEETRPGEYMPIEQNERGSYIFNSKDLCMIEHIPEMIDAGIDSFKIEGRMKTALYVAMVARTYRCALDMYLRSEEEYRRNLEWLKKEVRAATFRPYSTGFYFGRPGEEGQTTDDGRYVTGQVYLGRVDRKDAAGRLHIIQKNKFATGSELEIMKPDGRDITAKVVKMQNAAGETVESCPHAAEEIWLTLSEEAEEGDILRTAEK